MGEIGKIDRSGIASLRKPMTTSVKPAAFLPLAKLPRTPASDLKKLGWRGIMNALRSKGKLVVTNHDEPEAVIIPVAEYDAIMQLVEQSEAHTESALAGLRRNFDERLSVLQGRSAATRLQSTMRGRAKLGGKVKAGSGY
jgi:prevent-host-death family protein